MGCGREESGGLASTGLGSQSPAAPVPGPQPPPGQSPATLASLPCPSWQEVARLLAAYYRQWEQQGGPDAAGMLEALNKARCAMELSLKSGVMVRPGAAARYATQLRQLEGQAPPVMLDQLLLLAAAAAQAVACSTTVLEMMRMARLLSLAAMLQLRQEHLQHGVQLSEPERAKRMLKRDAVQALLEAELQRAGGAQIYHLTQRLHAGEFSGGRAGVGVGLAARCSWLLGHMCRPVQLETFRITHCRILSCPPLLLRPDAASNLLSPHVNDEFVSPLLTRVAELGGGSGSARALAPWLASKIEVGRGVEGTPGAAYVASKAPAPAVPGMDILCATRPGQLTTPGACFSRHEACAGLVCPC